MNTEELNKIYGESRTDTNVFKLGEWKLGDNIEFKDGKTRKLIHIEYRNAMIDLLRFDDGKEIFTGEIKDNFKIKNPL